MKNGDKGPRRGRGQRPHWALACGHQGHGSGHRRRVPVALVNKIWDGRPHIADMIRAGEIQLVFTTVDETRQAIADSRYIRTAALANRVTYYTTMAGCEAATEVLKHQDDLVVVSAGTARAVAINLSDVCDRLALALSRAQRLD